MRKKKPIPLSTKFPNVDPLALNLLERLIAFDPNDRPSAEQVNSRSSDSLRFGSLSHTVFYFLTFTIVLYAGIS